MNLVEALPPHALAEAELQSYRDHGFLVRTQLFAPAEIQALRDETDRLITERTDLISPQNLRCRYMPHVETDEPVFEVFDPVSDISPLCAQFANDPRLLRIMECLLGEDACVFKEKLIFKPAGALGYNLHQDIPRYWDGFPRTFLTVLIPIDATTELNGCTEVFRGYHHDFLSKSNNPDEYMLPDSVVDAARGVKLILQPGDIAVFHGLTPHRSAPNRSSGMRRSFYVSYNARSDGGDQRAAHYAEFQERMGRRLAASSGQTIYFR